MFLFYGRKGSKSSAYWFVEEGKKAEEKSGTDIGALVLRAGLGYKMEASSRRSVTSYVGAKECGVVVRSGL